MRFLRLVAGGAIVGAAGVAGTIVAVAASGGSGPTSEAEPLAAVSADAGLAVVNTSRSATLTPEPGLEITLSWEDDGTLCAVAALGNGGPGSCFTTGQIEAGAAYMRYQEKETTDGLLVGIAPDGTSAVVVDGDTRVDVVDNVWYAWVAPQSGGSEYTIIAADGSAAVTVDVVTPAEQPVPEPG